MRHLAHFNMADLDQTEQADFDHGLPDLEVVYAGLLGYEEPEEEPSPSLTIIDLGDLA